MPEDFNFQGQPLPRSDRADMPLFYSEKEQRFANSLMSEQLESVAKSVIRYYLIDRDKTIIDQLYQRTKN